MEKNILKREGAKIIVNGRSEASVNKAIETIRESDPDADVVGLVADNGTMEGVAQTTAEYPQLDIVVNNLGIFEAVDFFDLTDEAWQHIFDIICRPIALHKPKEAKAMPAHRTP